MLEATNYENEVSSTLPPLIFSILFIMIPFLLAVFLTVNRTLLNKDAFKVRYGAMYSNLKAANLQAALYNVYFVYRRLLFALTIIYAGEWAGL
jgi:hypothetical protein